MLGFSLRPEIIILDDDRDVGETLELILNKLGYQSVFFDSVEQGKQYFERELNPIRFSRYSYAGHERSRNSSLL